MKGRDRARRVEGYIQNLPDRFAKQAGVVCSQGEPSKQGSLTFYPLNDCP
jgi:hypothetical protein